MDLPTILTAVTSSLGLSTATAAWLSKSLVSQRLKKELEQFKSDLERERERETTMFQGQIREQVEAHLGDIAAERDYAFDAKKRLYVAIGPLKFQLLLACRDLSGRIKTATSTGYDMKLSEYYGRSCLFQILRPLALAELIEQQVAYADFSVDSGAVELLRFKKNAFAAFSGESVVKGHPALNWNDQKQHVFFGNLGRCTHMMIVADGEHRRALWFHEFDAQMDQADAYQKFDPFPAIFEGLDPRSKPLFWARLIGYGYLCNNLINVAGKAVGFEERVYPLRDLLSATCDSTICNNIDEYVERCKQLPANPL